MRCALAVAPELARGTRNNRLWGLLRCESPRAAANIMASNPLSAERAGASVSSTALTQVLAGSAAAASRRAVLAGMWYSDPVVKSYPKLQSYFLHRTEQYKRALTLAARLQELRLSHALSDGDTAALKE